MNRLELCLSSDVITIKHTGLSVQVIQYYILIGDVTPEGIELNPPPGHFDPKVKGKGPPKGFDVSQIYLSPSIRYSGCDVYAPKWRLGLYILFLICNKVQTYLYRNQKERGGYF